MATCNGERFLREQLESIAGQTRRPQQLVVCDDASQDGTTRIVEEFAARAPLSVSFERNPERLGTTRNFERAVGACDADIILLADQDDVWHPEKVARLCAALETPPGAGAAFSDGRVVDAQRRPLGYGLWEAQGFSAREQARVRAGHPEEVFLRHVVAAGTTLAFRARYRPLLLPFPDLRSAHDAWVAFLIAAVSEVALVDAELIDYRLHGDNQFGLRRFGLRAQLAQARVQVEQRAFDYAARFFAQAARRLRDQHDPALRARRGVLEAIDAKVAHARVRAAMPGSLLGRLPTIARESASGRYRRYSYGWKSAAQDLFLRG